jgi:hypothetical protein
MKSQNATPKPKTPAGDLFGTDSITDKTNMKLKYITFATTGDFEKWQDENPQAKIHQITPIIGGLKMNQTTSEQLDATIAPCAVFVLYHE